MIHDLKTAPEHFAAILSGLKTAELRKDDRNFAVGDTLLLREWNKQKADDYYSHHYDPLLSMAEMWERAVTRAYTGRALRRTVTHIVKGGPWLASGYVMLSLGEER